MYCKATYQWDWAVYNLPFVLLYRDTKLEIIPLIKQNELDLLDLGQDIGSCLPLLYFTWIIRRKLTEKDLFGSSVLSGKMLLVKIVEKNKIDDYLGQVRWSKC